MYFPQINDIYESHKHIEHNITSIITLVSLRWNVGVFIHVYLFIIIIIDKVHGNIVYFQVLLSSLDCYKDVYL